MNPTLDRFIPALVFVALLAAWEGGVWLAALPPYVLPAHLYD